MSGGPLEGIRLVEMASEQAALAGKLLGDLGADVIVVEPPGGHLTRTYGPFADDRPGPENSLWWWYYNTSKRSVVLDLDTATDADRFRALVGSADLVLEGEHPDRLDSLRLDHVDLRRNHPELIWVSVTPFGRSGVRPGRDATDLTVLAGGGPIWNCGYDDHTLPPVRGGGNQGYHIASSFAAMSGLAAYLHRNATGVGQHIDVSMHAAANVTTESGSFFWLVAGQTVHRQTGRHAAPQPSMEVQVMAGDGRYVTTGFPPNAAKDFQAILDWLDELAIRDEFAEAFFLETGVERGGVDPRDIGDDAEAMAIYGAGREALCFIASRISAYDFFVGSQARDIQCGIVYAPEEVLQDRHFVERDFPVDVYHEDLGRTVTYPGAPFKCGATPWRIARRAPHVGEHTSEVFDAAAAPEPNP